MAITTSGTTLTFNDATTQTTAPVNTNANVTSATAVAGTGISVTGITTTGAATHTITNTGVTSAVAGRGIAVSGATGAVTVSAAAGAVLQVISTVLTSYQSTTSSSMVTASLAVSITPQSSSNKIYVTASLSGSQSASNGSGYFTIYRGSTDLGNTNGLNVLYTNASFGNPFRIPVCMQYLDSPSTTSSTTYTVYFKTNTVGTVALNQDSTSSVITVMEVAG